MSDLQVPSAPAGFGPFSPQYLSDPHEFWQSANAERVFYYEPMYCWVLSRYEDVAGAFRDWETFSSRVLRAVPLPVESRARVPAQVQSFVGDLMDLAIINMDPPEHTMHRKSVQKAFTRPLVASNEPMIRGLAKELMDGFAERGSCDLMSEFCHPLTLGVITRMLGLPPDLLADFGAWIDDVASLMTIERFGGSDEDDAQLTASPDELEERYLRVGAIYPRFREMLEERRASPTDDLTSAMLQARNDEGTPAMLDENILGHIVGLTIAGSETTASFLGEMVMLLGDRGDLLEEILAAPELWEPAIEEGLRRRAIANNLLRVTTREVTFGEVTIPAGAPVLLNLAGADSDPSVFPDPLEFELRRENAGKHIAFGLGRHFCSGAPLARLESRCVLQELYGRLPELKPDPDQDFDYKPALTLRGLKRLQVSWSV